MPFVLDCSVTMDWFFEDEVDARALALLARVPVIVEPASAAPHALIALARRHQLSSYDSSYLELALRLKLPLATRDQKLNAAARAARLELL